MILSTLFHFKFTKQCKILHEKNNHSKSNQCCICVILVYGLILVFL
jgi:hypothetical protein